MSLKNGDDKGSQTSLETEPAAPSLPPSAEAKLRSLIASRRVIPAGKLQFINLERVRGAIGENWPEVEAKAGAMARGIVERHLTKVDICIPCGDLAFLILFGEMTEQEAQVKCGFLANEICTRLLGEDSEMRLADIRTVVVECEPPPTGKVAVDAVIADVLAKASRAEASAVEAAGVPPVKAFRGDMLFGEVRHIYRPLWDVRRQVLSTYLCVPVRDRLGTVVESGYDLLANTPETRFVTRLDILSLQQVAADLEKLASTNRQLLLSCTVHYETLRTSQRRTQFLRHCWAIDARLRKMLIIEVTGIPRDAPSARLLELFGPLSPVCRAAIARLPIRDPRFDGFREAKVLAVGADASDGRMSESEIMANMNRFVEAASRARLRTFVHGLRSLSLASAAVCAGFDYIDGDVVQSAVGEPDSVYRFKSLDLFRTLMHQRQ